MNYDNVTTDKKSMTTDEVYNKNCKTLKILKKDLERRSRQPSNRLGKNAKKESARRAIIMEEEIENVEEAPSLIGVKPPSLIGVKPPRVHLGRMKRKPGHRDRRSDLEDDIIEDDIIEDDIIEEDIIEEDFIEDIDFYNVKPPPKMQTLVDTAIKQFCSNQDIVIALTISHKEGVLKEDGDLPIEVIADMDGHGNNLVPDIIKQLDFAYHFQKANTPSSMQASILASCQEKKAESDKLNYILRNMTYTEYMNTKITKDIMIRSGTTYSAAFMHRNEKTCILKVVAEWIGDSPIFVFVNGELKFQTIGHHTNNDKEVALMIQKEFITSVEVSKSGGFEMVSEDELVNKPGKYAILKGGNGAKLACTRSLGHDGITCIEMDTATIIAKMTDDVKVIVCSDGVGDMINLNCDMERLKTYSAEQLVHLVETRWKQTWKYHGSMTQFPSNGYDDCSAAVWWYRKV